MLASNDSSGGAGPLLSVLRAALRRGQKRSQAALRWLDDDDIVVQRNCPKTYERKGQELMKTLIFTTGSTLLLTLGCAGNHPPPTQQMADVQSANRSATELGAQSNPKAQLHLKLAQEQLERAKVAMQQDDNQTAEWLLRRAKADAELAVALTRDASAQTQASKALDQSNAERSTNAQPGAAQ
jgi:hypothetical protein